MPRVPFFSDFFDYAVDATQRSVLFWDTLRERGNEYLRHNAAGKPPLLKFAHELLLDGRTLEHPANYPVLFAGQQLQGPPRAELSAGHSFAFA